LARLCEADDRLVSPTKTAATADHAWPGVLIKMRQTRTRLRSSSPKIVSNSRDVTICGIYGWPVGETGWRRRLSGRSRASGASPSAGGCNRCS
jgi:hypothetical protein